MGMSCNMVRVGRVRICDTLVQFGRTLRSWIKLRSPRNHKESGKKVRLSNGSEKTIWHVHTAFRRVEPPVVSLSEPRVNREGNIEEKGFNYGYCSANAALT
jgi:hypothetical protein